MTNQEKKRLSAVLRATEYLFLENIALKLLLEHRQVANCRKLLDRLCLRECYRELRQLSADNCDNYKVG